MSLRPYLTLRMLRLHIALIVIVTAFTLLANWQVRRALSGNALSWAYAIEWPLFIVYAFVLWRRLIFDELGRPLPLRRARVGVALSSSARTRREERRLTRAATEDRERERYNRYLAQLARVEHVPSESKEDAKEASGPIEG